MNLHEARQRVVEFCRNDILLAAESLPRQRSAGNINRVLRNCRVMGQSHVHIGIMQWRAGEIPLGEFSAGLDAIVQGATEAIDWPAERQDINVLDLWFFHPIAYLMDRSLPPLEGTGEQLEEYPLIAASFLLADALYDRPYKDRLPRVIKALGANKRRMLALQSFQSYFDLLEARDDETRVAELAAQGDALYLRRAKNAFYDDTILGGGSSNQLMLDWQLAAVLKKVGFSGESLHRWRWD